MIVNKLEKNVESHRADGCSSTLYDNKTLKSWRERLFWCECTLTTCLKSKIERKKEIEREKERKRCTGHGFKISLQSCNAPPLVL